MPGAPSPRRHVDRSLAAEANGFRPVQTGDPREGRPSVDEKRRHYWSGAGWSEAYEEVLKLFERGAEMVEISSNVGWTPEEVMLAVVSGGTPPRGSQSPSPVVRRRRVKRSVDRRVASLGHVPREVMRRARRLYEVEYMTIQEVSDVIGEPHERTYLILKKAGTRFRSPGRRPSA